MGLPPTSSKISTDLNEVTTFKFDFPNFTGTHTGTDLSLGINSVPGGGTGLGTLTANNVILGNGASAPTFVAPGSSGNLLTSDGTTWVSSPGGAGTGTVTSVALADGSTTPIYSISGSPVTTSGTLTETLMNQNANLVFAGPSSGSPAQPTFRALTNADLPSGSSAFASYASSQVTTASSTISSGTFTTFSNSPAFTITPTITGTYKIYCSIPLEAVTNIQEATARIFNTSGGATLSQESQAAILSSTTADISTVVVQSNYILTSGVTYVFDIQGSNNGGGGTVENRGDVAPFYMFAEGIGLATSSPTGSYAQAYFSGASTWSTTSASFVDPTNSGGNALTVRVSNNITLTAAASNVCGITFTPASSSAVYQITAQVGVSNSTATAGTALTLSDGTIMISSPASWAQSPTAATTSTFLTVTGIYAPATSSPVTVKFQMAAIGGGTAQIIPNNGSGISNTIEWTVLRIA